MTDNWGATVRCGRKERSVPTTFGPQPEWAKEEDDDKVMDYLTAIKELGYKYPGLDGFPWERARVEHSLLAIDVVPSDLSLFFSPFLFLSWWGVRPDGYRVGSFLCR